MKHIFNHAADPPVDPMINPQSAIKDPYNFPMPGRTETMSLSVINQKRDGERTNKNKFYSHRHHNQALETKDISGAQPKLWGSKETTKPEFQNTNWDIDRSGPRALHIGLNKPEYNLTNNDIEGSQPKCVKFNSTRQGHDPLNPKYQLAQVEMRPNTPPKFLRDNIGHDDIEGSKPKKQTYYET